MEVYSAGEGKGCTFMYKIPMTRRGASEESRRAASTGAGEGKGNDDPEDRPSSIPRLCIPPRQSDGDGSPQDGKVVDEKNNEDNEAKKLARATASPRRSRGAAAAAAAGPTKQPSPARPLRPPVRSPRRPPAQLSSSQQQQDGSVEVTRDTPTHPCYTHPKHPSYQYFPSIHPTTTPHHLTLPTLPVVAYCVYS